MSSKISLFIPVYNGARLIRGVLRRSFGALQELHDDFEIVIVDDNSSDRSYRFERIINKGKKGEGQDIRYVRYTKGPSRRENLAASFSGAKHELIGFIDADFSCDISYLVEAIKVLNQEAADVVIGSRYIKGAKAKRRPMRRIFSFFYNATIRFLFGSKITDHQCGLKVFRRSSAMAIIEQMGYDDEFIRGWFWDAEFLIRAQKEKLKIIEMPVEWRYADESTFNFRRELRCLRYIIKARKDLS